MRASLALALSLTFAGAAHARETVPPKVQQLVKEMMADYNTGDFQGALDKATEAYKIKPLTALLFNMGQFHKELQNWERAEFFFKRYLAERPDAPNRNLVEKLIAEVQAKEQEAATAKTETPAEGATPPPAANPTVPPKATATASATPAPTSSTTAEETPPQHSHVAGYALIGGGALLAIGAGLATIPIFALNSVNSQIQNNTPGLSYTSAQNAQSNARTFEGVSIGLGIAALACFSTIAFVW